MRTPRLPSKIHRKFSAETTVGATQGIRSTPVQNERQRIFDIRTSAISMPSTSLKPTEPKVNRKLL